MNHPQPNLLPTAQLVAVMELYNSQFAELDAVDALTVLGTVTTQVFRRLPNAQRMDHLRSWTAFLTVAVRGSLD